MTGAVLAGRDPEVLARDDRDGHREIGGISVAVASGADAARTISDRLDAGIFTKVAFLNAHCVNLAYRDAAYRTALGDFMVLPDGVGVDVASQLLYGARFPQNLNGTDFVPFLMAQLSRPTRVALVGSEPGIAERAAAKLAELAPLHSFHAVSHGYFAEGVETEAVVEKLRAARVEIVLVALGVPRQELFIAKHVSPNEATIAIAVGALLDFMAGKVPRAPRLVRALRLEWAFRLAIEPRRLFRRYVLGNPRFLMHVLGDRRRRARACGGD